MKVRINIPYEWCMSMHDEQLFKKKVSFSFNVVWEAVPIKEISILLKSL